MYVLVFFFQNESRTSFRIDQKVLEKLDLVQVCYEMRYELILSKIQR